jgi:hypothetical protein
VIASALRCALGEPSDSALARRIGSTPQRLSLVLRARGRLTVGELVAWLARVPGVRVVIDSAGARVEVLQGEWSPRGGHRL